MPTSTPPVASGPAVTAPASLGGRRTMERTAAEFAAMSMEAAEDELTRLTEQSIRARRMEEAILWQRVRYRSRLIRAQNGAAAR